jgi:hypothetical protein
MHHPDPSPICDPPSDLEDGCPWDCECPTCAPHLHHPAHVLAASLSRAGYACRAEIGEVTTLAFQTERGARSAWRILTGYSTMDVALDGLTLTVAPLGTFVRMAAANDTGSKQERQAA